MNLLQNFTKKSNTTETVYELFRLLDVKVTATSLEEQLENHPDYPSMLSISDVLSSFDVENVSLKASMEQLAEMPMPCIAPIQVSKYDEKFTIIKFVADDIICYLNPESFRFENISFADFEKKWLTGFLMLVDAENAKGEDQYLHKIREETRRNLLKFGTYATIPALVFLASTWVLFVFGTFAILPVCYLALMLAGLITSGLLLWYEIDENNPALHRICNAGAKVNCSTILSASASKIGGVRWTSIGIVYFFGGIVFLLVQGIVKSDALVIMSWLSIIALPFIMFSVYYQWQIAKQWCVLCLIVQGILASQGLIVILTGWGTEPAFAEVRSIDILISFIISYFIPVIALSIALPALRLSQIGKQQQKELKKFKHNPQIFQTLLEKQKKVNESTAGLGITLGNPDAVHKIIKVCNPYCIPCDKAHKPMKELLSNNSAVQVQIIFTTSNDENDVRGAPVRHLLAIQERYGEETIKHALSDWYLKSEKDYGIFAAKYPMNGEVLKQAHKLRAMNQWCKKTNITFTPTFFINGHQLPEMYTVNDLKYFLSI